ncbi:uncharacterized protein LOC134814789 [Bolinopsis microptera]|uniref:uncharacterized protein LOC134814789 n=1 Tax=Bolinopsis microptera TaxID=2820187 RepID=UPI003079023B
MDRQLLSVVLFIFPLLCLVTCDDEYTQLEIDAETTNSEYVSMGLKLRVLKFENEVAYWKIFPIALNHAVVGLSKSDVLERTLSVAMTVDGMKGFEEELKDNKITETIDEIDSLEVVSGTLEFAEELNLVNNTDPEKFDFGKIWDVETIENYINETVFHYPWITELDLGESSGGRMIKAVKVSRYPNSRWPERYVHVFMGSWSGAHWTSMKLILKMMGKITEYDNDTYDKIHPLVTRNTLYFIPLPNPDGYHHTISKPNRFWNKNLHSSTKNKFSCEGVNLDRNARPTVTSHNIRSKTCNLLFDGLGPYSENETQIMVNLVEQIVAESTHPIHWYQMDDSTGAMLIPPWFSESLISSPKPNLAGIMDFFKNREEQIQIEIANKAREKANQEVKNEEIEGAAKESEEESEEPHYGVVRGMDSMPEKDSSVPRTVEIMDTHRNTLSHFLDTLITKGVTQTYSVGIPLSMLEFIRPVGDEMADIIDKYSDSFLRAVDQIARPSDPIEPIKPILTVLQWFVPIIILAFTIIVIFKMHDDTLSMQVLRAKNAVKAPKHVKAVGAMRLFDVTVKRQEKKEEDIQPL